MKTIGFIGVGNMGRALLKSVCARINPAEVAACDHHAERLAAYADEWGFDALEDAAQVVAQCEFVVLGVKPGDLDGLVESTADALRAAANREGGIVLCSLAAGFSLASFDAAFAAQGVWAPVVRMMPNSGVAIGQGVCLFAPGEGVAPDQLDRLMDLFSDTGLCEQVDEPTLAAAVPIFSCSPAAVYMFIESLADAGVQLGLERDLAMRLAKHAVQGSAANAIASDRHVAQLREDLSTPGGMTITATNHMEKRGFRAAIIESAVLAFEHSQTAMQQR